MEVVSQSDRATIDVQISDRALRELDPPPFEAAVREADVASFMCSYNQVNGAYSCESRTLLTGQRKEEWGFAGFVQSDFFAACSTAASALAGLDLEMPRATAGVACRALNLEVLRRGCLLCL